MQELTLQPIGVIESPFVEKFGLPRQPGHITAADARIKMLSPYNTPDAFRGINDASHLWLTFGFHQHYSQNWKPLVRPPRLGGNKKLGVFATRSSFRPNPIGLSVVALRGLEQHEHALYIRISCPDILHGTPIYDIKPYLPYADALPTAHFHLAETPQPDCLTVRFSPDCLSQLAEQTRRYPRLETLITECLAQDPRPAYRKGEEQAEYGIRLYDLNIRWQAKGDAATVLSIETEENG